MKKNGVKIGICIFVVIILLLAGIVTYYFWGNGEKHIKDIKEYSATYTSSDKDAAPTDEELIKNWIEDYMGQYEKFYIPRNQKVQGITINQIENIGVQPVSPGFLDSEQLKSQDVSFYNIESQTYTMKVALVDFTVDAAIETSDLTLKLDGSIDEAKSTQIQCQWVLYYQIQNKEDKNGDTQTEVTVYKEMRPAAYDLIEYNESGQAAIDKQASKDAKIANGIQRDSEGKAIGQLDGTKFWFTSQVGYNARILDRTMNQESREIYRTEDGGATWIEMGWAPSSWAMLSYSFVTENLGFFCYKWIEGEPTNFYRTQDGGATFSDISLPKIEVEFMGETYTPFIIPEAPWKEDGALYMYCAQDENGDYNGGKCKALLKSEDDGKTWIYTDKIVDFKDNDG